MQQALRDGSLSEADITAAVKQALREGRAAYKSADYGSTIAICEQALWLDSSNELLLKARDKARAKLSGEGVPAPPEDSADEQEDEQERQEQEAVAVQEEEEEESEEEKAERRGKLAALAAQTEKRRAEEARLQAVEDARLRAVAEVAAAEAKTKAEAAARKAAAERKAEKARVAAAAEASWKAELGLLPAPEKKQKKCRHCRQVRICWLLRLCAPTCPALYCLCDVLCRPPLMLCRHCRQFVCVCSDSSGMYYSRIPAVHSLSKSLLTESLRLLSEEEKEKQEEQEEQEQEQEQAGGRSGGGGGGSEPAAAAAASLQQVGRRSLETPEQRAKRELFAAETARMLARERGLAAPLEQQPSAAGAAAAAAVVPAVMPADDPEAAEAARLFAARRSAGQVRFLLLKIACSLLQIACSLLKIACLLTFRGAALGGAGADACFFASYLSCSTLGACLHGVITNAIQLRMLTPTYVCIYVQVSEERSYVDEDKVIALDLGGGDEEASAAAVVAAAPAAAENEGFENEDAPPPPLSDDDDGDGGGADGDGGDDGGDDTAVDKAAEAAAGLPAAADAPAAPPPKLSMFSFTACKCCRLRTSCRRGKRLHIYIYIPRCV